MSHDPPVYPLLEIPPVYDTKLADPQGKISLQWDPSTGYSTQSSPMGTSLETHLRESRKRYRSTEKPLGTPGSTGGEIHPPPTESGDDMVVTDCEPGPERASPPTKRRMTSAGPDADTKDDSGSSLTGSAPSSAERDSKDGSSHVIPCTPVLPESPGGDVPESVVSENDPQSQHQLVLPSPSASPIHSGDSFVSVSESQSDALRASRDRSDGHGNDADIEFDNASEEELQEVSSARENATLAALQQQLSHVPATQSELIATIMRLSSFVSRHNHNHLVYSLLQRVERSSLSALCDVISQSLSHDILASLPYEVGLNVLSNLDFRSLLAVSQVSRRWRSLVGNTELWTYLLRRDSLLTDQTAIMRELRDPTKLSAEWASASPYLPDMNSGQLLYKKRYLIFKRWMDPAYEPKRVSISGLGSNIVTCLQHDEDKIITGIEGRSINIHSTKHGALANSLQGHDGGVWALKYFSNTLVSGSTDRDVRIWNIRTGKCTHVFRGHTSTVRCLDILHPVQIGVNENGQPIVFPERPLLVTGSRDHNLHVWKLPLDNEAPGADSITETKTYEAKDPANPYILHILTGHSQSVRSVTGYGNIVVSGSYDATVRVWDLLRGGECRHILEGHSDKIYSTAMNFNTRRCYSGSMDSSINVWDFEKGKLLHSLEGHSLLVGLLELSDKYLVSAAADSTLRVWDPKTGENFSKLKGHNSAITCFQHDALRIVSGSERMLKLWNIKTGKFVRDLLSDITGSIWQVSFDADRCVAAVQTANMDAEETFIEILDFSTPLNER